MAARSESLNAKSATVAPVSKLSPEKREQILNGAFQVFLSHGYEGASMDRIAAEARVSKPTIYSHFKDKDGLFAELIERVCLRFVSGATDQSIFALEPPAFLPKFAANFLKRMDDWEYIAFMRLLLGESGRFPELAHLYVSKVIQPSMAKVTAYFTDNPQFQFADPDATARIFVGALNAHITSQEILGAKHYLQMPRERYIKALVDMVLDSSERYRNR